MNPDRPGRANYLAVRLVITVAVGWMAFVIASHRGPQDFEQVWYAARTLLEGHEPYATFGPGRQHA